MAVQGDEIKRFPIEEQGGAWSRRFSSLHLLMVVVGTVFISEFLVMALLDLFELPPRLAAVMDPVLLSLFLLPIFLFFIFRPMKELLALLGEQERALLNHQQDLEERVRERTDELYEKNESLYREIREKVKIEEDLLEKNAFLEIVIESLDHPFYVIDASNYDIKLANRASGFKNCPPGSKCYELTHQREAPCSGEDGDPCLLRKVVETGEPQVAVHTHFDKDGNPCRVEIHTQPIRDRDGNISSVIEFVMGCRRGRLEGDITGRPG